MRKVYSVLIGIFFTLAFTTCKQFNADIDEYLSYWSAEAFIRSASIEAVTQTDVTGVASVASEKDVTVTLKVQNPKSFRFALPSASETRNIVHFEQLTEAKPVAGTDYELKQLEGDTLQLIYKTGFLKKHEWGEKDLSSVITLIAQDGRVFKQTYTFRIKANTPPPKPIFTVAKTVGTPAYYVLCITVPNMDKRVSGGLLHKDMSRIEVNGTPYTFSVNEAHNAFTKPESDLFITASDVEKLTEPGAEEVPAGGWVLHYKTDVEVKDGAAKKEYTIRLSDEKGLVSGILNASTKPNKPTAEGVTVTKGERVSGSGGESDPVIIGSDSAGAALAISSATGGTTVHCTLTDIDSAAFVQYDGNPISVPLPLNGAGEKKYKLEYYTDGEGFAATAVKTVYYTIRERYTVTFDADGGTPVPDAQTVLHGGKVADPSASVSKTGFYLDGWYTEDAHTHKWDFNTDTVTRTITLYANWIPGSGTRYTVEHYQQNINDDNYSIVAADTELKTGTTGQNAAYTPKAYEGFTYQSHLTTINGITQTSGNIAGDNSTVVRLYYKRKQYDVTFSVDGSSDGSIAVTAATGASLPTGSPVKVKYYGEVTFTATPDTTNGWEVEKWTVGGSVIPNHTSTTYRLSNIDGNKNVTVTFKKKFDVTFSVGYGQGGSLKCTYNGTHETSGMQLIHVWEGDSVEFTAVPDAANGWEVQSWMVDSVIVHGHTSENYTLPNVTGHKTVTVIFKKKTYTVKFSVAEGEGKLQGAYDTQNQTVQNGNPEVTLTNVPHGTQVPFTAEPEYGWEVKDWTASAGTLSGGGTGTTARLTVTDNATVKVKFKKITTVNSTDNLPWKLLKKVVEIADDRATITIDGEIKATSGDNAGQIVITKTLTIRGKTGAGSDILDANTMSRIFKVENGATLFLENLKLTGGKAYGGGAIYASNPIVNITNCIITGNEAETNGGGIYVEGGTTNITNCIFTGNTAKNGGGIYMTDSSYSVVTISGGTIGGTGPNEANKATGTDGNGGGIYVGYLCDLRLNSALLITSNKAAKGGGVYANYADVSMQGGTRIAVDAVNNDVYLDNSSRIKVFSTLTAEDSVARITVPDNKYNTSTQVLIAGTGVDLASEAGKFTVTPKGSEHWIVGNSGTLLNFGAISRNEIKALESSMSTALITNRENLVNKLLFYKTSAGNYGVMVVTEVNATSHSGRGHIKFNYKTFNADGSVKNNRDNCELEGIFSFDLDADGNDFDFFLNNSSTQNFQPKNGAKFYVLP